MADEAHTNGGLRPGGHNGAGSNGTRSLRILLVDDEPDILDSLAGLLRAYVDAAAVSTASSAIKALDLVKMQPSFHLIITDFHMPDMDGVEFLQLVDEMYPETPSVLFSGDPHGAADALARSPLTGVTPLHKPIEPSDLLTVVTRLTDARSLEAPV